HERGGARHLRGDPPRRHAEERARHHADARRAVQVPGLSRLRGQARSTVRRGEGKVTTSEEAAGTAFKPRKSVTLSGVTAGNTALCTVGRTGNDLHYRGYDILDVANACEFEEIAHLLVHGSLPNRAQLNAYKTKLKSLRGLPGAVRTVLEQLPK